MPPATPPSERSWVCAALVAAGGLAPGPTTGQGGASPPPPPRTVTVTAGPEYRAGWLHQVLFGRHYRDLWITPIDVELLDLGAFAGGLTPLRRGGGAQTRALRLAGADGREYVFRSVNKHPSWLPADLRETIAERVVRDQISVLHPGAALVAAARPAVPRRVAGRSSARRLPPGVRRHAGDPRGAPA